MNLLKPASLQVAYLKAGIFGFGGSGKTFTSVKILIGICKSQGKKKIAFFDTETGSDYIGKLFKDGGIELVVFKGRAFKDLLCVMREAESDTEIGGLVIDSISHVWRELMDSYIKRLNRKNGLFFSDYKPLKGEWQQFTDLYLNSKLHIMMCGRAGFEYENEKNEETGRTDLIKTGTKMKVEGEMGYEPSLLLEMERERNPGGQGWKHVCVVLKDRFNIMNGKEIVNPDYKDFLPFLSCLNLGGEHIGVDVTRNSEDLFDSQDHSYTKRAKMKEIILEDIGNIFIKNDLAGRSDKAVKEKISILESIFKTASWAAIEAMHLETLQAGKDELLELFIKRNQGPKKPLEDFKANETVAKVSEKLEKESMPKFSNDLSHKSPVVEESKPEPIVHKQEEAIGPEKKRGVSDIRFSLPEA